jgi:putative redox protein
MEITVNWAGLSTDTSGSDMFFTATTGSGYQVAMDGAPAVEGQLSGGKNLAPRPMEMVLLGTGGCTAYDVVLILRRARQNISSCEVTLKAERAETDPKVFTKIHFHFIVRGHGVKKEMVQRAIDLSHEKYCSASVMLAKTAELTHSFELIEEDA